MNDDDVKEWGYFLGAWKFSTHADVRMAVAKGLEAILATVDQAGESDPYLRDTARTAAVEAFTLYRCHGELAPGAVCSTCGTMRSEVRRG